MPKSKNCIRPYGQGNLDGFCGLYSVINSTKLIIKNISQEDSKDLIHECITALERIRNKQLSSIFIEGISAHDVSCIFKNVIEQHYPIKRYKPFHSRADVSIHEYWETMKTFLDAETSAAIICIGKKDWSHWTVAKSASDKRIYVNDSGSIKHINKTHCSLNEITKETPLRIYATATFFLAKRDIKK